MVSCFVRTFVPSNVPSKERNEVFI
ncbi:antisense non-coding [Micromonas commoda]|uniref:Antisense non-coding n=1 Tax=Micromonas commoda (strain RCC299 / NOUM17 / CCMP2709) TaxID=296587 RepID=C1FDA7_MICCC|nr:antisense non-coding [Micromonas commoda]ACO68753.1 antisense non-coding [Micromonas commoda]|eukprot:XP_002507495.1 antisense non-coding [Micromonas commoda]